MIEIDQIEGLVYAIGHAEPYPMTTELRLQKQYWSRLKELSPTWRQIEGIVINTTMPLSLVKEMFGYVLEEKLLHGLHDEQYYLYLWEHTLKDVDSVQSHIELLEKEKPTLLSLLPKKKEEVEN